MAILTDEQGFRRHIKRELISEAEIKAKLRETGAWLSREYADKPLMLVSVLKGSYIFLADLTREITIPCEIGFMAAQSYFDGTSPCGTVDITYDLNRDIRNYHVVIVEDIVDTGRTLKEIVRLLRARDPLSLRVVTLLDKPSRRKVEFKTDRSLFTIEDHFVIGYGLDCGEYYRNLPYIAEYDPEADENA